MILKLFKNIKYISIIIFLIYLLLTFIFHGFGINLYNTALASVDSFFAGYPSKIFS
jgi:hypothetical protein